MMYCRMLKPKLPFQKFIHIYALLYLGMYLYSDWRFEQSPWIWIFWTPNIVINFFTIIRDLSCLECMNHCILQLQFYSILLSTTSIAECCIRWLDKYLVKNILQSCRESSQYILLMQYFNFFFALLSAVHAKCFIWDVNYLSWIDNWLLLSVVVREILFEFLM